MVRVGFHYLGCRLNEAENESIARRVDGAGYEIVPLEDLPDIIVLNTCGVTGEAMRKSRNLARRMAALSPGLLVLMGCAVDLMAQGETPLDDVELCALAKRVRDGRPMEVVRILEQDKADAAEIVLGAAKARFLAAEMEPSGTYRLRTRSFIKIEDGCNNRCTYCSVRLARGRERSVPASEIVSEIRRCLALGEREIVLTGVQLGAWKEGVRRIDGLIAQILDETAVERLRISSIEPWHVREPLWRLWKDRRLCPHFHIPIQSGSDAVLQMMGRRTAIDPYLEKIRAIREAVAGVRISTDLIVGFPGETDEMWAQTMALIERAQFDDVHLFRFSARPGTVAATLPGALSDQVKRARWHEAQARIGAIAKARRAGFAGSLCHVLWETSEDAPGHMKRWSGYSQNYLAFSKLFPEAADMRAKITTEIYVPEMPESF